MNLSSLALFRRSKLVKDSGIYVISTLIEKGIPFLLLPILTRYLSPKDYGLVAMYMILVGFITPFINLGVRQAVLRTYFKVEVNFKQYVFNVLFLISTSGFVVGILVALFSEIVSQHSGLPEKWVFIIICSSIFQLITNLLLTILRAESKPIQFGLLKIAVSAINLGLSVYLIVIMGHNWTGRTSGHAISVAFFGLVSVVVLLKSKRLDFTFNKEYIRHALKFGVPMLPHVLSGLIITMSDRLFITNMVGLTETGLFTVGYQVGVIIDLLAYSFSIAWSPWLYKQLNNATNDIKSKIVKISYIYLLGVFALAILLSLTAPFFMDMVLGKSFQGAVQFVIWIAMGHACKGGYYILYGYLTFVEKTYLLSRITIFIALLNMLLNYLLIRSFGAMGAAYATTISLFCQAILVWVVSNRVYPMPWLNLKHKLEK